MSTEIKLDSCGLKRYKYLIYSHLKNIFTSEELSRNSVVAKNATTATNAIIHHYFPLKHENIFYSLPSRKSKKFQ